MTNSIPLDDFYDLCQKISAKPHADRSPLEFELLELEAFRAYTGNGGSVAYFIENTDNVPSRLASLLKRIGPPRLATLVANACRLFPDDMPKTHDARQVFLEARFERIEELGLTQPGAEVDLDEIDTFVCCDDEQIIFAKALALYADECGPGLA